MPANHWSQVNRVPKRGVSVDLGNVLILQSTHRNDKLVSGFLTLLVLRCCWCFRLSVVFIRVIISPFYLFQFCFVFMIHKRKVDVLFFFPSCFVMIRKRKVQVLNFSCFVLFFRIRKGKVEVLYFSFFVLLFIFLIRKGKVEVCTFFRSLHHWYAV